MKDLIQQYESTKQLAKEYMNNGQLNDYLDTLLMMNKYKKLMTVVVAN